MPQPQPLTPSPPPTAPRGWWRRGARRRSEDDEDFVAFATVAAPRLGRTAYLLCRDWHLAQDLTQTTLAKLYVSWRRISRTENIEAYSRKVLLHAFLDHRRRRSSTELVIAEPPESGGGHAADLRLTLLDALGYLSERDRAILVLRYWEDQSVETVAESLGLSTAMVKTRSMRSLARLRHLLADTRAELFAEDPA